MQVRTCTVHNEGAEPLHFTPALVEGDDFSLVGDTSAFDLPAGAARDLTVRFAPMTVGAQFGRVVFGQPLAPDLLLRATVLPPSERLRHLPRRQRQRRLRRDRRRVGR